MYVCMTEWNSYVCTGKIIVNTGFRIIVVLGIHWGLGMYSPWIRGDHYSSWFRAHIAQAIYQIVNWISSHCVKLFTHIATPWSVAHQAPLSMEFSRQEYWSVLPFPSPGDLIDSGIEVLSPVSPAMQADSLPTEPLGKPKESTNYGS